MTAGTARVNIGRSKLVMPSCLTPLPIVLGPTGSGKSELAIQIARAAGGEIVNCDSLQVYRGFDIGTAKTPDPQRRGVPHHLIDVIEPQQLFTAGDYAQLARAALREIAARRRIPVIVGGTGFYLRALLDGLVSGTATESRIAAPAGTPGERKRPLSLHRILLAPGPHRRRRAFTANDKKKIIRALEVRLLEGRPISELFSQGRDPLIGFRPIKLGLNPSRALLNQRLDARTVHIFEAGLLEEVRALLSSGVSRDAKPFESLGYKQALGVLEGRITLEQALESTQLETRQYAKRQVTWFRKEPDVQWLDGFGDNPEVQTQALAIVAGNKF